MHKNNKLLISFSFILLLFISNLNSYEPDWKSLDQRPIPDWYDKAKIGIFIHWGVFSVPAAGFPESAYLWYYINGNQSDALNYMNRNYPPGFKYPDFGRDFKAEFYDPNKWLDIFNSSGAKYVVFVTKHHEGYSLWPSAQSWNWNSKDIGPNRDLFGEFVDVVRKKSNLRIGAYYSLFEFFNALYLNDKESNFTKDEYVQAKMIPQLKDLIMKYKPEYIWSDGDWETDSTYFKSKEFLAWLYTDSPVASTVVVNDRWGTDASCRHGDINTCTDRYSPRQLQGKKFENAMTLDLTCWGYRHNFKLSDIITIEQLLNELIITVSFGGNMLINVGPTSQGVIPAIFEERLRQMGQWLDLNGESIYETQPWLIQNDTFNDNQIWYTSRISNLDYQQSLIELYAITFKWPHLLKSFDSNDYTIKLNSSLICEKINYVSFLGYSNSIKNELDFKCVSSDPYILFIDVKDLNPIYSRSKYVWTFKIYLLF